MTLPPRAKDLALAALGLLLVTFAVHGQALGSAWKFDDPGLLHYALSHTPWQTFTSVESMRALSYAFLTPWNAFFFQLGLPWFGLHPAGHYAHMLLVLWAASVATWWLLAAWRSRAAAWLGAALFLASAPTASVAGYDDRVRRFMAATAAGARLPASFTATLTDRGLRKFVQWRVEGPPGAMRFDIHEIDRIDAPTEGRLAFGRDISVRGEVLHLHVTIETADGAMVRSPLLVLPLSPSGSLSWRQMP